MSGEAELQAPRRELKFRFAFGDVDSIRAVLRSTCDLVVHRYPVSTVRSLYFDDTRLTACRANLNGISIRRKLRLRWYDARKPSGDCFFEIKWRRNRVTGKRRHRLDLDETLLEQRYSSLVAALASKLPDSAASMLMRNPRPIVLVEYKREHYMSVSSKLRLTLDYDLRFLDQTSRIRPALGPLGSTRLASQDVIVEAKCPVLEPGEVSRALYPLRKRPDRFSKYIAGCHSTGLVDALG